MATPAAEVSTNLIEWFDIVKIVLGFVLSIILFKLQNWYTDKRKIRCLQESIWKLLTHQPSGIITLLEHKLRSIESLGRGNVVVASIETPAIVVEVLGQLASLDSNNASLYHELICDAQLSQSGNANYKNLLYEYIKVKGCEKESGVNSIAIQRTLIGLNKTTATDRFNLAKTELKVITFLSEKVRFGTERVEEFERNIDESKEILEKIACTTKNLLQEPKHNKNIKVTR